MHVVYNAYHSNACKFCLLCVETLSPLELLSHWGQHSHWQHQKTITHGCYNFARHIPQSGGSTRDTSMKVMFLKTRARKWNHEILFQSNFTGIPTGLRKKTLLKLLECFGEHAWHEITKKKTCQFRESVTFTTTRFWLNKWIFRARINLLYRRITVPLLLSERQANFACSNIGRGCQKSGHTKTRNKN